MKIITKKFLFILSILILFMPNILTKTDNNSIEAILNKNYIILPNKYNNLVRLVPPNPNDYFKTKGNIQYLQAMYDYNTKSAEDYMFEFQDGTLISIQPHYPRRKRKTNSPEFYKNYFKLK